MRSGSALRCCRKRFRRTPRKGQPFRSGFVTYRKIYFRLAPAPLLSLKRFPRGFKQRTHAHGLAEAGKNGTRKAWDSELREDVKTWAASFARQITLFTRQGRLSPATGSAGRGRSLSRDPSTPANCTVFCARGTAGPERPSLSGIRIADQRRRIRKKRDSRIPEQDTSRLRFPRSDHQATASTKGTLTRCSLTNQDSSSLVRSTSLTTTSLVPSSPNWEARRARVRLCRMMIW